MWACRGGEAGPRTHRVVVAQGDVFWADLPDPIVSGPGFRRPVVVLIEHVGRVSKGELQLILTGIDVVLGRGESA